MRYFYNARKEKLEFLKMSHFFVCGKYLYFLIWKKSALFCTGSQRSVADLSSAAATVELRFRGHDLGIFL